MNSISFLITTKPIVGIQPPVISSNARLSDFERSILYDHLAADDYGAICELLARNANYLKAVAPTEQVTTEAFTLLTSLQAIIETINKARTLYIVLKDNYDVTSWVDLLNVLESAGAVQAGMKAPEAHQHQKVLQTVDYRGLLLMSEVKRLCNIYLSYLREVRGVRPEQYRFDGMREMITKTEQNCDNATFLDMGTISIKSFGQLYNKARKAKESEYLTAKRFPAEVRA